MPGSPRDEVLSVEALESLTHKDLVERVQAQSRDLKVMQESLRPFEAAIQENVTLAKALQKARVQIDEVLQALHDFFSDPTRKQWFQDRRDDGRLCNFFQKLVVWYRVNIDEGDPTVRFYQKVWMYERGGDEKSSVGPEGVGKPTAHGDDLNRSSSSSLYDACRTRAENMRLESQVNSLQAEKNELNRLNEEMHRTMKGLAHERDDALMRSTLHLQVPSTASSALPQQSGYAVPASSSSAAQQAVPNLRTLASKDDRWRRLIDDPDGLFSIDDVIDATYQEYLEEVLDVMVRHDCSFKDAISKQVEQMSATPRAGGAAPSPGFSGGGEPTSLSTSAGAEAPGMLGLEEPGILDPSRDNLDVTIVTGSPADGPSFPEPPVQPRPRSPADDDSPRLDSVDPPSRTASK